MKKKLLSLVMALAMICGFAAWVPELSIGSEIKAGAYTAHTREEALNWIRSQVGKSIEWTDASNLYQCVDFVQAYYAYLGVQPYIHNAGNYSWADDAVPSGWQRIKGAQPQPGDILIYTNSGAGHVGLYESDYCHYHQNIGYSDGYHRYVEKITWKYNGFNDPYWGVIRPDFSTHSHNYSSSVTNEPTCTTDGVRTYTCSCGDSYTETIPALGHDYVSNKVRVRMNYDGYTEYVCSRCGDNYKDNTVYKPELESDGWYHCAEVPEDIDTEKYEIQYNNYYEKIQSESPGDDWVNEGTHSDEWVNSGDPYKSLNELETSDSRVLLSYKYFHFCGPNAGASCNYEMAGNHVHYDEVSPSSVTVEKQGWDTDGNVPYFILNWNNGGGRVYCESGVTCDGSWGSHGRRGYAWYKESTYQDRIRVTKYKFTKSSGWTSSADPDATRTQIRFKTNHIHTYTSKVTKKATCTSNGVRTYTCSCGDSYTKTIKKLGHSYTTKVVKPTCTTKGYTLHKCSRCGDSYKDTYKSALGHTWGKWTTTKKATCTTAGSKKRVCEDCGEIETATIKKLGHSYTTKVVKPTCTKKGYTLHKCSRCGDSYKDTYKDATGHKWSKWTTTGYNFSKNTSSQQRTCANCNKVETQTTTNAIERLAGANRYETAGAISSKMYKTANTVIIATGLDYHDALVAVPLAKVYNAPLLLATDQLVTKQTEAELARLKAKKVIIVSTNGAVGNKVKTALKKYNPTMISGSNCYETSVKVAQAMQKKTGKAPSAIFFATGSSFADALSASPVAAIKNAPIIYLRKNGSIDSETISYLFGVAGSVKNAYVIGGDGVISNAMMKNVAKALGLTSGKTVQRVAGANRYETCVAVNKKFKSVLTSDGICVAKGLDFPDALAGGVYAAATKQALFLADGKKLQDCQNSYLKSKNAGKITIFGGTGAVPDDLVKLIAKASV